MPCKAISNPPQHRGIIQEKWARLRQRGPLAKLPAFLFLLALAFSLQPLALFPAIIWGNLVDLHLAPMASAPITFYPTNTILVTSGGLSAGPAFTTNTTASGAFTNVLDAGPYTVCLQLNAWRNCFTITVPGGTNSYNITNLLSQKILADDTGGAILADP